ncbi:hypothetical protein BDK51DRAFT_29471, partial [Blyttiomyces helicus]
MQSDSPTSGWTMLHDRFYRKLEFYTLVWNEIDLAKFIVAVAPYGGPIGVMGVGASMERCIDSLSFSPTFPTFYTSQWDKGRIAGMGWTNTEHLITVLDNGTVRVYHMHGEPTQFSLGEEAAEFGILEAQVWESGLVALTGNLQLVYVTDLDEPRPKTLANPELKEAPHCWTIIPPEYTLSGHLEVLLAVDSTVLVADPTS